MKGQLKAYTTDKYLLPVRKQLFEMIDKHATVVEFGCGNGDQLFHLSSKIQSGIGIDFSQELIECANQRKLKENVKNLEFFVQDLTELNNSSNLVSFSLSCLLYHTMSWDAALEVVQQQVETAQTTLICGFSAPETWKQKSLLLLDQRFTKHYPYFKTYARNGYTIGMLQAAGIEYNQCISTFDPVIKVYRIEKNPPIKRTTFAL